MYASCDCNNMPLDLTEMFTIIICHAWSEFQLYTSSRHHYYGCPSYCPRTLDTSISQHPHLCSLSTTYDPPINQLTSSSLNTLPLGLLSHISACRTGIPKLPLILILLSISTLPWLTLRPLLIG